MIKKLTTPKKLTGELNPPGDKSISHRSIILNALAKGTAQVSNYSPSEDFYSSMNCLEALGVDFRKEDESLIVTGAGGKFREPEDVLSADNSATTMRLMTGILAAQPFLSVITGDASLRARPMDRVIQPLRLMGAQIWGRSNDKLAPLVVRGTLLHGIEYTLPVASAQLKSALILAALFAQGKTAIIEPAESRDHTERMLVAMGAKLVKNGRKITVSPINGYLSTIDVKVPADISAAAFWLVAGTIHPDAHIKLLNVGINPTRSGIIDVLKKMGAKIKIENERIEGGEPVADLSVKSSNLSGIEISGDLIPRLIDEIPVIAVAAATAKGTTTVRNAEELRVKESDRISSTVKELTKLGVDITELSDGFIINGKGSLKGARCNSHGDHRLAMALGIAGLITEGELSIYNAQVVRISYPEFWNDLIKISK
ncbi:MAG: 3-phosphoshikimate 1-carboxyvinyltransferase [Chloroflexi bacterium]|nr:3-phosphoshikimate 1-carboxyvinyltransferase [Chloroflexota bacterium]